MSGKGKGVQKSADETSSSTTHDASHSKAMDIFLNFVNRDLDELKQTVTTLVRDNIEYKSHITSLEKRLRLSEGLIAQLRNKLVQQENEILDLKCLSVRDNIVIKGIKESANESWNDTREKVVEFAKEKLKITNFTANAIDRAHRMGRKIPGKQRPIVAKMKTSDAKSQIFANVRNLKGQNNVSVQDQLPPEI